MVSLLNKKNENQVDVSELKTRVKKIEGELERLEKMEKSLAYHESVLTKKVSDMYRIESKMEDLVHQREMMWVKEELKKFDKHEELLFENAKFIREIVNEISKVKQAHNNYKTEKNNNHSNKASKEDLMIIKNGLQEKISQIENQNKLLMKYLKKVDEQIFKKNN